MVAEVEALPGHEPAAHAHPLRLAHRRAELRQDHRRVARVRVRLFVFAMVIVHLERPGQARHIGEGHVRRGRGAGQIEQRPLKVVITHHHPRGLDPGARAEVEHLVLLGLHGAVAALRAIDERRITGDGRIGVHTVGEHEPLGGALVLGVGEGEEDPLLREQPEDEVEIALLVLNAVLPSRVLAKQVPVVRDVVLVEHQVDDLTRRLVLEDAAVDTLAEEPEAGHQAEAKGVAASVFAFEGQVGGDAAQVASRPAGDVHGERDGLTEQRCAELTLVHVLGPEEHIEGEEAIDLLVALEGEQVELTAAIGPRGELVDGGEGGLGRGR